MSGAKVAEAAYTIPEAAAIKRVSPDFIRAEIKRIDGKNLRAKKVGRGYRIPASALEEWFDALPDG